MPYLLGIVTESLCSNPEVDALTVVAVCFPTGLENAIYNHQVMRIFVSIFTMNWKTLYGVFLSILNRFQASPTTFVPCLITSLILLLLFLASRCYWLAFQIGKPSLPFYCCWRQTFVITCACLDNSILSLFCAYLAASPAVPIALFDIWSRSLLCSHWHPLHFHPNILSGLDAIPCTLQNSLLLISFEQSLPNEC